MTHGFMDVMFLSPFPTFLTVVVCGQMLIFQEEDAAFSCFSHLLNCILKT